MRQEWLHHANWFLQLHDVSHRSLQIAPGVSVAAVRRVSLYVINDAALAYMEERNLPQIVIGKFKEHKAHIFSSAGDWESHLHALGLSAMKVTPIPCSSPAKRRYGARSTIKACCRTP